MVYNTAKVMSKGQITLPIDMRRKLNLNAGDRVALIYENNRVVMMNPAIHALEEFQKAMMGEAERTELTTEESVIELCREVRASVDKVA